MYTGVAMNGTDAAHIINALIIPHPAEPHLLVGDAPGGGLALPEVEDTEGWHWAKVDWLNARITRQLGIPTTVLRCVVSRVDQTTRQGRRIYVLEMHSPDSPAPAGTRWAGPHEIARTGFADGAQQAQVETWLAEATGGPVSRLRSPWARPGWFAQARDWIEQTVADRGLRPSGAVEQIKVWTISSILRGPTTAGDLYFKVSGTCFPREAAITGALSALAPAHTPEVVAADPARSWLLMRSLTGTRLDRVGEVARWEEALRTYARIQIEAIPHTGALVDAGCRDRRLDRMHADIDAALTVGETAEALTDAEMARLRARAPALHDALDRLRASPIPDTLEHGDFHAANIMDDGIHLRIFDWSDACIAHPFFSLLPFFEFHTPPAGSGVHERLLRAYLEPWTEFAPMPALRELVPLAQRLAVIQQVISYQLILDAVEPALQWEWLHAIPYFLRMLLRREPS
jgi:hypothetical protein